MESLEPEILTLPGYRLAFVPPATPPTVTQAAVKTIGESLVSRQRAEYLSAPAHGGRAPGAYGVRPRRQRRRLESRLSRRRTIRGSSRAHARRPGPTYTEKYRFA
ncbi:hypothetical protein EVAR_95742_1 [Eumeta japonica]|uniref:Uncharacterized protein n=1 Tax=Eumeta variegata TaxID=151549 RepID=A0A4C1ULV5_EUMVA|nr:hypothetical protein EVAR_95742_1 [Eumeta japonica]